MKQGAALPLQPGATWRAVILGLLLIVPQAYFSLHGFTWGQSHPATVSLYFNVVVTLFLLALLNMLLRRFVPRLELGRGELVVIYGMLAVVTALYGHDQLHNMVPVVAHPCGMPLRDDWEQLFVNEIPEWLTVRTLRLSTPISTVANPSSHRPTGGPG